MKNHSGGTMANALADPGSATVPARRKPTIRLMAALLLACFALMLLVGQGASARTRGDHFTDKRQVVVMTSGPTRGGQKLLSLSQHEHVWVTNGAPGLGSITLDIDGRINIVLRLKAGESRQLDLGPDVLHFPGNRNVIVVFGFGPPHRIANFFIAMPVR